MTTWTRQKLGDIVDVNLHSVKKDFPYTQIEYIDISSVGTGKLESVTYLSLADAPSRAKRLVENGDTILATVRPNRRSFLYIKDPPKNRIVSTGFAVLTPSHIDSRFLYYLVSQKEFTNYLSSNAKGAAYPAVDENIINRAEVLVPDLPTQTRIASVLSAYDDLIENNEKRIKILEEMAERLYREWFVKFKFPGHEKVRLIDSGTEYGKIPEGWEVERLASEIELVYGKALKAKNRTFGEILVCGSGGIVGTHDKKLISGPGIVIGRKGNAGTVFWVDRDFWVIDTAYFVKTKLSLVFTYYLLKTQNFVLGDAAVPGLNREQAYRNTILIPPNDLIHAYAHKAEQLRELISKIHMQNSNLSKTRDLLIPLVTGKRKIKN
jgi:type I restriction enzyme, S subunit